MFVVVLRFTANRDNASQYLEGHKDWIGQGIDAGVFLVVGTLQSGGAVPSWRTTRRCPSFRAVSTPIRSSPLTSCSQRSSRSGQTPSRVVELDRGRLLSKPCGPHSTTSSAS